MKYVLDGGEGYIKITCVLDGATSVEQII